MLILVQDREEAIRKIAEVFLHQLGYDCVAVETPEDVLRELEKKPSVVLCGVSEWLSALHQNISRSTPVVVLSYGTENHPLFNEALSKGARGYIRKPLTKTNLQESINKNSVTTA
jgi:CheY-like chemotaxis protein